MVRLAGLEPATLGLEGRCSIQLSYKRKAGRGRGIRTPDILLPKQARYQTALYPDNPLSRLVEIANSPLKELRIITGGLVTVNCFLLQPINNW
jgi:hypothetical protein